MCLMCVELARGRMKVPEARRALWELVQTAQDPKELGHYKELSSLNDEQLATKALESLNPKAPTRPPGHSK